MSTTVDAKRVRCAAPGALACLAAAACLAASGCGRLAAHGLNAEGVRLFEQARYDEAIQHFDRAVYRDPANADAYYNLASAYHRKGIQAGDPGTLRQAERYYHMARDRDPDHRESHRGLAVLLAEQGRSEEAFRLLQGWADRRPASPEPKVELARLMEEHGDRRAAEEHLLSALAMDSGHTRALVALGRLREESGSYGQALENYQRALAADRFQPAVAARVGALQSTVGPQRTLTAPPSNGNTRIVGGASATLR